MTTRLYLDPYNGSSLYVSPHIGWDITDSMVTSLLLTQEQSVDGSPTPCWLSLDDSYGTAPKSSAGIQFISKPLKPQTISGTFKGQLRAAQDGAGQGFCRAVTVRVMSGDGSVERGTLLQHIPASLISEFATTLTNRNFPPSLSLTEVVAQDGDVLVIEIGAVCFSDLSNYPSGQIEAFNGDGGGGSVDLPEDEVTTDMNNSWFEFSQTIEFQPPSFLHESLIGLCLKPTAFWPPAGRLFFGSAYVNPPEISPAFSTSWDVTDGASRASFAKISDTNTWPEGAGNQASQSATSQKVLIRQYISPPLAAQTITGTVKGQILAHENQNYYECSRAIIIRVFSGDGLTERGVVLSDIPSALESEFILGPDGFSPFENRNFPPVSPVTEVQVQEGDVLIVEVGFRSFNTAGTAAAMLLFIYNFINAQDLPVDETTVFDYYGEPYTEYNTWLQFSNPLVFQGEEPETPEHFSHQGNITLTLTPIEGPPSFTHEGNVALSLAFTNLGPPAYTQQGHVALSLVAINFPDGPLTSIVADGGFILGGDGDLIKSFPQAIEIVGSGGFQLGGAGALAIAKPKSTEIIGSGGFIIGGKGILSPAPPVPSVTYIVGSGGFQLGGAGVVASSKPKNIELIGSGGFVLGLFRLPEIVVTFPSSAPGDTSIGTVVEFGLGGEGVWETSKPRETIIVSVGACFSLSGTGSPASKHPTMVQILGEGGFILTGGDQVAVFDTWALSGQSYEPSYFTGWNFNSYAAYRDKSYGAGPDGIYLLEGPDDNGQPIRTGVRIGPVNFGTDRQKRLRSIQLGKCGEGVQVKVLAGDKAGCFDVIRGRAQVNRDLQDREFTIEIAEFEQLGQFEITPLVLVGR